MPTTKYPWKEWFSKPYVVLKSGVDFDCVTHGMIAQIRRNAAQHKVRVSVSTLEDYVVIERVTRKNQKHLPRNKIEVTQQVATYGKKTSAKSK